MGNETLTPEPTTNRKSPVVILFPCMDDEPPQHGLLLGFLHAVRLIVRGSRLLLGGHETLAEIFDRCFQRVNLVADKFSASLGIAQFGGLGAALFPH